MSEDAVSRPADAATALHMLGASIKDCRACRLCEGRTQVVFGVGSPAARLLFVGEGPGFHEDRQGEPFVGQAGKLLNTLLEQIGLSRADVYIANVVKCRPPENRDPAPDEIEACSPHLKEQIAIIKPNVVCTLGRFAAKLLTGTELSMSVVHGKAKPMVLGGVEVVVFPVYHPAAALYAPANRVVLEEDFAKLRVLLARGLPDVGTSRGAEAVAEAEAALGPEAALEAEAAPESEAVSHPGAPHLQPCEAAPSVEAGTQRAPTVAAGEQLNLW